MNKIVQRTRHDDVTNQPYHAEFLRLCAEAGVSPEEVDCILVADDGTVDVRFKPRVNQ